MELMLDLLKAFAVFLAAVVTTALSRVLSEDLKAWTPWIVRRLIRFAVARLPENLKTRFDEEWTSHTQDIPGDIAKIVVACGFIFAAVKISRTSQRSTTEPSRLYTVTKRSFDIVLSVLALVVLLPVFVAIAAAVKLTSRGPIFFAQTRIGQHGLPFVFLKFRTMYSTTDNREHDEYVRRVITAASTAADDGVSFSLDEDPRVTAFGYFLRRTSLDDLPQLLNVLKGDMTLVGPRPPIPYEWEHYEDWHKLRMSCKPGMTGLSQVASEERKIVGFDEMVRCDLEYVRSRSLLVDLIVLLKTPRAVLIGRD